MKRHQQKASTKTLEGLAGALTFHEYQLEINRLEAKLKRQRDTADRTAKLIESLKGLQEAL